MPKDLQYANVSFEVKQIEENTEDGFFRFEGLASTFGNIDLGDDVVESGAFKESLQEKMPIILWQHNQYEPIGMPEEAFETPDGLFIKVKMPIDDDLVRGRVIPQIKVGSIRTMSIGFRIKEGGARLDDRGIRFLTNLDLKEVSLVTFPMNPQAKVTGFKSLLACAVEDDGKLNKEKALCAIEEMDFITDEFKTTLRSRVEENPDSLIDSDFTKKYIMKSDLGFLDSLESGDQRALEKALSDSGLFSKNAAVKLVSFLNKSDSSDEDDAAIAELSRLSKKMEDGNLNSLLKSINSKLEK